MRMVASPCGKRRRRGARSPLTTPAAVGRSASGQGLAGRSASGRGPARGAFGGCCWTVCHV